MAVCHDIGDNALIELRIGNRQGERGGREGGDIQFVDRLRLDHRRRALETDGLESVAFAEMLEEAGFALSQRLDQRRQVSRGHYPSDADFQRLGAGTADPEQRPRDEGDKD